MLHGYSGCIEDLLRDFKFFIHKEMFFPLVCFFIWDHTKIYYNFHNLKQKKEKQPIEWLTTIIQYIFMNVCLISNKYLKTYCFLYKTSRKNHSWQKELSQIRIYPRFTCTADRLPISLWLLCSCMLSNQRQALIFIASGFQPSSVLFEA